MATATETPTEAKELFAGAWRRKRSTVRINEAYRKKRVEELLLHLDIAAYLYAIVLVQRCGAAVGCKLTRELAELPPEDLKSFWESADEWTSMIRGGEAVKKHFKAAPNNEPVEELIQGNEETLREGLLALRHERRWLAFVDAAHREEVSRNVDKLIVRLDSEQAIDARNDEARRAYADLAKHDHTATD